MTAHIDPKGRVLAASPAMRQDILLARVQGMIGSTPFSTWANLPALLLALISLGLGAWALNRQPNQV